MNGLKSLLTRLRNSTDYYFRCPLPCDEWHTETHVIYMLLVGMFGSWGTSIRSGWIEQKKECVEYIREICSEMREAERLNGDAE